MHPKKSKTIIFLILMLSVLVPVWECKVTADTEKEREAQGWKELDSDATETSVLSASDYVAAAAQWKQILLNRESSGDFDQMVPNEATKDERGLLDSLGHRG